MSSLKYSLVISYIKQQTDWLQPGRVSILLPFVNAHNDYNHSAAVCVKDR